MPESDPASAPVTPESVVTDGGSDAPRRNQIQRAVMLITAIVAIGVIAFIAFGSSSSGTLDPVAQAATASANMPGFAMRMTMRIQSGAVPQPITGTGSGHFDTQSRQGTMSFAMHTSQGTLDLQEVLDGTKIYVKLPSSVTGSLPLGGKPWISIDLTKLAGIPGAGSLLSSPASSDPSQMLEYLRAVSDSVVSEGSQKVDGVQAKHYRAQINFDKVPDALPSSVRADAQKAITALESQTHIHIVPVDVWVDSHHLVRRMEMSFNATDPSAQALSESFTIDFLNYGPQAKPAIPPSSQVTDISSILGSGG
jgi:hypothetical protein